LEEDTNSVLIEQWKIKRLIKKLDNAKGNGTSMITLIIPPKKQMSDVTQRLTEEFGAAVQIKSNVVRKGVQTAITSARERVKLYPNKAPTNGLILFCGEVAAEDSKNFKKVLIDFEPFRPIPKYQYLCDSKFHTDDLKSLLEDDETFGFIVVDGHGCLFGKLQGNNREIVSKFNVELPKKHRKGGQSSVRFARLRIHARQGYVKKVCESITNIFITNNKPNVAGLIMAGSADFKSEIRES
jgi:peptide chain release factor subunit 1